MLKRENLKPEVRRDQLLDCAMALFIEHGFERTTIAEIIMRAGISKGGFYHHFRSKEELLERLAERFAWQSLHEIDEIVNDPALDPFQRFDKSLRRMRMSKANMTPQIIRVFESIFTAGNEMLFHRIRLATCSVVTPMLARILEDGVADGTFAVPDPELAAQLIMQINAASYDVFRDALASRNTPGTRAARDRLLRMTKMQGIAVDRLLGLPDNSIVWAEEELIDMLLAAPR